MTTNLPLSGARLWDSLMELAKIGGTPKGGCNRQTLTDLDSEGRHLLRRWGETIGCTLSVDRLGNMVLRREGRDPTRKPVAMGSHLDTQPTGGKFDGPLGVLAGLEVLRGLHEAGIETEAPLVLINWTNEEGARFSPPMMGSGAAMGIFAEADVLALRDTDGKAFGEELTRIGWRGTAPADAREFLTKRLAVRVTQGEDIRLSENPHRRTAAHHGGRKTRPFLIGPIDQHQRRFGFNPRFMQPAQHFKPGQHTKRAVKLAAGGLRIQMAAHGDRFARGITPFAAQHHIAEAINGKRAPNRLPPTAQQMAAFGIKIRQRLPIAAALGRAANLGEFHQAIPKPGAGKGQVRRHDAFSTPHHSAMVRAMVRVMSCMDCRPTLSSMP